MACSDWSGRSRRNSRCVGGAKCLNPIGPSQNVFSTRLTPPVSHRHSKSKTSSLRREHARPPRALHASPPTLLLLEPQVSSQSPNSLSLLCLGFMFSNTFDLKQCLRTGTSSTLTTQFRLLIDYSFTNMFSKVCFLWGPSWLSMRVAGAHNLMEYRDFKPFCK